MKPSTTTLPIDSNHLFLLTNASIVGAFINALPPRGLDLHGTSVDFFFVNGGSCSIDGSIIDIGPKEEVFTLCIGKTMEMEVWRKELLEGTLLPVIKTTDLYDLWSREGLGPLLVGPRSIQFYKRVARGNRLVVEDVSKFEAIRLYVPGTDKQSLLFYASEDCPGDVVVTSSLEAAELNDLVEWDQLRQLRKVH